MASLVLLNRIALWHLVLLNRIALWHLFSLSVSLTRVWALSVSLSVSLSLCLFLCLSYARSLSLSLVLSLSLSFFSFFFFIFFFVNVIQRWPCLVYSILKSQLFDSSSLLFCHHDGLIVTLLHPHPYTHSPMCVFCSRPTLLTKEGNVPWLQKKVARVKRKRKKRKRWASICLKVC